jgi:hypothetical protein
MSMGSVIKPATQQVLATSDLETNVFFSDVGAEV